MIAVSFGGAAILTDLFSTANRLNKWRRGELGVERYKAAHWLAYHLCTCQCCLAISIVAALIGVEEIFWLMNYGDYEGMADVLAEKMKSI